MEKEQELSPGRAVFQVVATLGLIGFFGWWLFGSISAAKKEGARYSNTIYTRTGVAVADARVTVTTIGRTADPAGNAIGGALTAKMLGLPGTLGAIAGASSASNVPAIQGRITACVFFLKIEGEGTFRFMPNSMFDGEEGLNWCSLVRAGDQFHIEITKRFRDGKEILEDLQVFGPRGREGHPIP